ncbi:BON domain-containing protein [Nodosilinea sp. FACHB-131]|uniref:BON domain-containing protein n=1 Tax=Cyanophyceae TaxID=3028117 RepID=UPI0016895F95|nr:BON domain-containing protein [Nodosilinea sp. FACHB-131]MBD1874415.1 BON domain-containing protein [Nodosilinea sp. FACHB-131]
MLISLAIGMVVIGLGLALMLVRLPKVGQSSLIAMACLAVMLVGFTQPAFAGAVNGAALTDEQKDLNETLQSTPNDSQYEGIEYADVKGTPLGDQDITDRVESKVPDTIKISVSNGSVRLSGKVKSRDTARAIIEDVKSIPGVHEVSYDIGLKEITQ